MAKLIVPESATPETMGKVSQKVERSSINLLDAAATGTTDGLKLYLNVLAMLIAFVSLVAVVDWPLSLVEIDGSPLSLRRIFGWVFYPLAWAMGIAGGECAQVGALLGTKVSVNEFVAYADLAQAKAQGLSPRSSIIAAYALCGFANFSSIGIQIGGIGSLVPERRETLARLGLRAMVGGALASWMTATIAGAFLDG
jgi:CNT family concentrative nucleoside transporter